MEKVPRLYRKLANSSVTGTPLAAAWGRVNLWFGGGATPLASLDSYIEP